MNHDREPASDAGVSRSASAAASTHTHDAGAQAAYASNQPLPVVIDGAVTPEKIPDDLAYHHFINALGAPDHPTLKRAARQQGLLTKTGLSGRDKAALVGAVTSVQERLNAVRQHRQLVAHGAALPPEDVKAIRGEEDDLVRLARDHIRGALTREGQSRLDAHIREHAKAHIKIYGALP